MKTVGLSKTAKKAKKFEIHKLETCLTDLSSAEKRDYDPLLNYDKKLTIVFHMEPIADSRPRVTRNVAISENILILRKNFLPHYMQSDLLKHTMISSPYHVRFNFYMSPSSKNLKLIGYSKKGKHKPTNKSLLSKFMKDEVHDLSIKDVDNMVKVYNDLLMTENAKLVLDDGYNVGANELNKYISINPRVEMTIIFSSKPNIYYRELINDSSAMFKFYISEKNMFIYGRSFSEQLKHLKNVMKIEFVDINSIKAVKDKIKQISSYFEDYWSAENINNLVNMIGNMSEFKRTNKTRNLYVLLSYLLSFNKTAVSILGDTMDKYDELLKGGVNGGTTWNGDYGF